jgi:hypothetical protein
MTITEGRNEARTLKNREIVALVRQPGETKWRIDYYETQRLRYDVAAGGNFLDWTTGVPEHWKELDFESVDEAVSFVEQEIAMGKVPSNSTW